MNNLYDPRHGFVKVFVVYHEDIFNRFDKCSINQFRHLRRFRLHGNSMKTSPSIRKQCPDISMKYSSKTIINQSNQVNRCETFVLFFENKCNHLIECQRPVLSRLINHQELIVRKKEVRMHEKKKKKKKEKNKKNRLPCEGRHFRLHEIRAV